jgi:hypothetical protein
MTDTAEISQLGPWNPGIQSKIPRAFLPLATVFCSQNAMASLSDIEDLSDYCGLPPEKISPIKPERLILHEVLIRAMTELTVPDGDASGDLGVNFRLMIGAIMSQHVEPALPGLCSEFLAMRGQIVNCITAAIDKATSPALQPRKTRRLDGVRTLWRSRDVTRPSTQSAEEVAVRTLAHWEAQLRQNGDELEQACLHALVRAGSAIFARRGAIHPADGALKSLAITLVSNGYGSERVGSMIDPLFKEAVQRLGFRVLPSQLRPLIMNTKGASASGKSTMRPLQRQLAEKIGVGWADFAIISPDIWRKYLLDYASLGPARRYAGALTAHEVEVIDTKLDRYMKRRASSGRMTHLLIDRFRFDSFAADPNEEDGSHLLTRFGDTVYMFFMITPPEATIERAWLRGEMVGRYKAVDDLLAHNVEAYSGIPALFFRWAGSTDKSVHYEFLDNSVPEGSRPLTVAFGENGAMKILDLEKLMNIDRYRKINIDAKCPDAIYPDPAALAPQDNLEFLRNCIRRIAVIEFANQNSGRIYARIDRGELTYWNRREFEQSVADNGARTAFELVANSPASDIGEHTSPLCQLDARTSPTIGRWGTEE